MSKKYEFTGESVVERNRILYRIQSLIDFNDVKKGDLGGWIESEDNLSHEGNCWVYSDACAFENAIVCDNAKIYDDAYVCENARVRDNAKIFENARVYEHAEIFGNAKVYGHAIVCGDAEIFGNTKVFDYVHVFRNAKVFGNANIFGNSKVCGYAKVCGDAKVYDDQYIKCGTVTKDILAEKDWGLALKCLNKNTEIKNGKYFFYLEVEKTRNKNIFFFTNNIGSIIKKGKIIENTFISVTEPSPKNKYSNFAKTEIDPLDVMSINYYTLICKKIKILDIVKGTDLYE